MENGVDCDEPALASDFRPSSQPRRLSSFALQLPLGTPAAREAAKSFWNTTMLYTSVEKISNYAKQSLSCDGSPVVTKKSENVAEPTNLEMSFRPVGLLDYSNSQDVLRIDISCSSPSIQCSRSAPDDEINRSENGSTLSLYKTTSCPTPSELAMMYSNSNLTAIFP